ncbi:TPA: restriction endonuclease subunit S [Enterococcus faecium]|nr:restriction endonuclease subunit S [Enterococcus faecium]NMP84524.1 restriction endonuclease subunit S [Enterococcus faecium]NTL46318.1 restriction endonuclease subunit S [Enterococcus faecium]
MSKKSPQLRFEGFTDDWEERKFKDILKTHSFRSYLADISENGEYEVIQQGDKPIVGYSDGKPFTNYKDITLFGDHTVSLYKPKRPFFVATDGVKILSADNFEGDYLYTTLERYKPEPQGYKRHFTILKNQDVWFTGNMEEQQKIGSFFKQLDITIALHQRKLDLLKEQKKGFLQKMFPKNGAKVPELRFKGFTDAWEQRKLGEVATLSSSKRIHLSDYVTEGIPFYRGSEISTGGITGNQELFISQEKFDEIKEKYGVPSEGDILVTAVGTLGNLWKVDSRRFYYKDGNLIQISKMQVNSDYLLTYFTGGIGKKRLLDSAAGSNQKALTMVKMREITVDFPSEDEQKKIGAFFKSLDDTIALHQRKLDLLKEQKKGFLQKMFV